MALTTVQDSIRFAAHRHESVADTLGQLAEFQHTEHRVRMLELQELRIIRLLLVACLLASLTAVAVTVVDHLDVSPAAAHVNAETDR